MRLLFAYIEKKIIEKQGFVHRFFVNRKRIRGSRESSTGTKEETIDLGNNAGYASCSFSVKYEFDSYATRSLYPYLRGRFIGESSRRRTRRRY